MPPSTRRRGRGRSVLITRDIDELTYGMTSMSTLCHVVGRVLVAVGLTMVGRKSWRHVRRWRVRPSALKPSHPDLRRQLRHSPQFTYR